MRQFSFSVGGMTCRRCVREVTALLRDVPGVETVMVDAARSLVTLTGFVSRQDVESAFAGTSHTAHLVVEVRDVEP